MSFQILNFFFLFFFFNLSIAQIPTPGKTCNGRYCLFSLPTTSSSFKQAQDSCFTNSSYLLELTDLQSKQVLENFIRNNPSLHNRKVLLNARPKSDSWTCIDHQNDELAAYKGGKVVESIDPAATYLTLVRQNGVYVAKADSNLIMKSALCSIKMDSSKTCGEHFKAYYHYFHQKTCYFSISGSFFWHQALNQCHLKGNASLATLHQASEMVYVNQNKVTWNKAFDEAAYWLGCASELWLWNYSDIPIIASDWFMDNPSGNRGLRCVYLQLNQLGNRWIRDDCSKNYTILCMTDNLNPTRLSSSSLPTTNLLALMVMILSSMATISLPSI